MEIILSTISLDVQECDVVATGFFQDERPLRGAPGWLDWRLNGRLSRFVQTKRFTGDWKETILLPSERRIVAPLILLIGLGRVEEYGALRLRELSDHLIVTLQGIKVTSICLAFPCDGVYRMPCGKTAEVLIQGIADCLERNPHLAAEEWVKHLRLLFTQESGRWEETLLGIQAAKSMLGDRLRIDVRVVSGSLDLPEEQPEETTP